MRQLPRELAACAVLLATLATRASAQQGSLQLSVASQSLHGDESRLAGQDRFEPDFGVAWEQPGSRFGLFQLELRATSRYDTPHIGKAFVSVRDLKYRGANWTFEAGDTYFSPAIGEYRLTNLATPTLTFAGAAIKAKSPRTTFGLLAGRATAWRNIFGTDPDTFDQDLFLTRGTFAVTDRLDLSARASRIRTRDLREFGFSIAASDQGSAGARLIVTPALHLVADGGAVAYRRNGSDLRELDGSMLVGASLLLARGWLQANVSQFSPGDLPVLNQPLADRRAAFAAGEYDLLRGIRLFGGWEQFRTNLDPESAAAAGSARAATVGDRSFGGLRLHGGRSSLSVRVEQGDRRSHYLASSRRAVSDTGVVSAEWQSSIAAVTAFGRYARRSNVEVAEIDTSYTQHESSGHVFVSPSQRLQLFGSVSATRQAQAVGGGSTYWQAGGGGQAQILNRSLWLRAEGQFGRNVDLLTDFAMPQQSVTLGLNGLIAGNTILGVNVYADRVSAAGSPDESWAARSTLRLTRTFATGSVRLPSSGPLASAARSSGTGSVAGLVFSDWNANGAQDEGEEPVEGIPIRFGTLGHTTSSSTGDFAFLNVPAGFQQVGLDLSALPVDFDPPMIPQVQLELPRGETKRVAFGLVPLGAIQGRVIRDVNGNGKADEGEPDLDGAVLTLDGGARSEQVRKGRFRFEAVRSGDHTLELLEDSLPQGSTIAGGPVAKLAIGKDRLVAEVVFAVSVTERPEIRKVFPSRPGPPAPESSNRSTPNGASRRTAASPGATPTGAAARHTGTTEQNAAATSGRYVVQVAAVHDPLRAREMAGRLSRLGFPAYVVEPSAADPDGPYRVRVGKYASRAAADQALAALQRRHGDKLWVVRER